MAVFNRIKTTYNDVIREAIYGYFKYRLCYYFPRSISVIVEVRFVAVFAPHLFDEEFYTIQNPDVAEAGQDPLGHYVRFGSSEGRAPHPLVDEAYYRRVAGLSRRAPISGLGHYLAHGRSKGLSLASWFDPGFYRKSNPGLEVARMDPFDHFVLVGAAMGCAPSSNFDTPHKIMHTANTTSVDLSGAITGYQESWPRDDESVRGRGSSAGQLDEPDHILAALSELQRECSSEAPIVDVIVPVYRGYSETLTCLLRILSAANATPFEVVVIDDASPEPCLSRTLRDLAGQKLITLILNKKNRGFVASMNQGMSLHPDRDVIWLNADTEVFGNWIDRLRKAAYSNANIATVTPFTNNGTICSYPRFDTDNPNPLEIEWPELDALVSQTNENLTIEIPTAVGFAAYVKRAAIEDIGLFDEDSFGHGYGEENDFCQRGRLQGWKDVLAANVFVRHHGATSFQENRPDRIAAATKILRRRYPKYFSTIDAFIKRDPARHARNATDRARLYRLRGSRNVLIVSHSRGGGTQKHVTEEIRKLKVEGASVYLLTSGQVDRGTATLRHVDCGECPSLEGMRVEGADIEIGKFLHEIGISEIHIHNLIDFSASAPSFFASLSRELGASLYFTLHDYLSICPRINLVDLSGYYCGEPGPRSCRACLISRRSNYGAPDIEDWREQYHDLLSSAKSIKVPSRDARDRLIRYFPDLHTVELVPHEQFSPAPLVIQQSVTTKQFRIGAIGAISSIKGFNVLLSCADHARQNELAVKFIVIGYTENDAETLRRGIEVTGRYSDDVALDHVSKAELDMIFLPSTWPETYSYTLSIALKTGLPIAAFDLGAIAERLRDQDRAILLPLQIANQPSKLISELLSGAERVRKNYHKSN